MPVFRRKQSDRLAAQLNSPPLTWMDRLCALWNGTTPGSRRWISAPRARKSRSPDWGIWRAEAVLVLGRRYFSAAAAGRLGHHPAAEHEAALPQTGPPQCCLGGLVDHTGARGWHQSLRAALGEKAARHS